MWEWLNEMFQVVEKPNSLMILGMRKQIIEIKYWNNLKFFNVKTGFILCCSYMYH